jgi:HlyD family secretion protein
LIPVIHKAQIRYDIVSESPRKWVSRVRLVLPIIVLLAASLGWLWWYRHQSEKPPAWQGYAEADYVDVGPVEAGLLTSLHVRRGDVVAKGTPLFQQDDIQERAGCEQAQRQLAKAQMQLANLEAAGKPTEIAQAEANLADIEATMARAKTDLDRDAALLRTGFASARAVDQRRADYRSAKAKFDAAAAALSQAQRPMGRVDEIKAQSAAVLADSAAVAIAEWHLAQRSVAAPIGGRVADVLAQPGETIPAGTPVVSILPPQNIFMRFFIPEADLSRLHLGDRVGFACDGCRGGLSGTVSYISPQAEYTPPVIYSETTRAKLVFRIEARPPLDEATLFNPGQPVAVRPFSQEQGQ